LGYFAKHCTNQLSSCLSSAEFWALNARFRGNLCISESGDNKNGSDLKALHLRGGHNSAESYFQKEIMHLLRESYRVFPDSDTVTLSGLIELSEMDLERLACSICETLICGGSDATEIDFWKDLQKSFRKMQRLELINLSYNQPCRSGLLSWLDRILKSHAGLRINESFDAKRRDEKNELTKLYHPRLVLNE
jgi:hypothetical protein